jgi:hypothetical protein
MTTFTLKDYVENKLESKSVEIEVEPIPFAGYVALQDKEDTEKMLRDQLHMVNEQLQTMQAENQRLKRKLRALGENE